MLRLPTAAQRDAMVATALGTRPADVIIKGGTLLNVHTGERYAADVAICEGWIAHVGDVAPPGPHTITVDATGLLLAPGLINSHFHIESSMLTAHELASILLPTGETTITHDPHEIGNVLGYRGMKAISEEGVDLPLKVLLRLPPQVPAVPDFETTAGTLSVDEFRSLLDQPYTISVGGDYNVSYVLHGGVDHLSKIEAAHARGLTVNGQESGLSLADRAAYAAGGPEDSEVAMSVDDIMDELRQGMKAMLNVMPLGVRDSHMADIARFVRENDIDTRHLLLCVSDIHPNLAAKQGSMSEAVRMAIRAGFDPMDALRMATLNAAEHYRVGHLLGSVSPGRVADVVLLSDLDSFAVHTVVADGMVVHSPAGSWTAPAAFVYPEWATNTMHVQRVLEPADFAVRSGRPPTETVKVNVIGPGCPKPAMVFELPVDDGVITPDVSQDVVTIAIVDRHLASGRIGLGFINGMGINRGAVACSINHDSHNLLVLGVSTVDMAVAANAVVDAGGGIAVVLDGELLGCLPLPIAGLMSTGSAAEVVDQLDQLESTLCDQLGVSRELLTPFMWFQCAALPNLPEIGLTDLGLFDTLLYEPMDLVVSP
jgi:adenine deaminase